MDARSLQFVAEACGGELLSGSAENLVLRVCTDSRQVQAGDLFVALAGGRFDGHDFVAEVARKAAAVMVERRRLAARAANGSHSANGTGQSKPDHGNCGVIAVENTRQALGKLAAGYRAEFT